MAAYSNKIDPGGDYGSFIATYMNQTCQGVERET